jgi:hypothetical protein
MGHQLSHGAASSYGHTHHLKAGGDSRESHTALVLSPTSPCPTDRAVDRTSRRHAGNDLYRAILIEPTTIPASVYEKLRAKGHNIRIRKGPGGIGDVHGVMIE